MAHIEVDKSLPGIRSLVMYRPESGEHLYALARALLRGESPIAAADRELIASYVSSLNDCDFCMKSHAAAAKCLYENEAAANGVKPNDDASIDPKLKALMNIAAKTTKSGMEVTVNDVEQARSEGAGDADIHDAVLIAAVFCMFNRYVDGLASFTPTDPDVYAEMGKRMVANGYIFPKK